MNKHLCIILLLSCSSFLNVFPVFSSQSQLIHSKIENLLIVNTKIDPTVELFYNQRNNQAYWLNKPIAIEELISVIKTAPKQGLPIGRYSLNEILRLKFSEKSEDIAKLDILLTSNFLLYANDISAGIIDPTSLTPFMNIEREKISSEEFLSELNNSPRIKLFLEDLQPKDPDYLKLQLELERLKLLVEKSIQTDPVPNETTLEVGMSHPNVLFLRNKLVELDYLQDNEKSETFDKNLLRAVMLFQENSGLTSDGVVGKKTFHALNVPYKTRIMQVLVNLERMRWLNFDMGDNYIIVNQPNYQAQLIKQDDVIWQSNVVIGLPDFQTAEFFDEMTHIIVNPTWHVPKSIAVDEYLPKIQEDPEFLVNNEMLLYVRGTTKVIDSNLIDMSVFTVDNFPFEIKQNPGNINALGQVKFMFPNKHSIYMHDTPMKPLFSKDLRAFSHGCVRLERPFKFANALLSDDEDVENAYFYSALRSGEETRLNLSESIPVYLTYRTVIFDEFGSVNYRPDIYGRDALVYMSLISSGLNPDV